VINHKKNLLSLSGVVVQPLLYLFWTYFVFRLCLVLNLLYLMCICHKNSDRA